MRFESTGTAAAYSSRCRNQRDSSSGFTLLEALVALAILLTFISVLVPYLFHARRIMEHAENRITAQILLRTLINAPFDRSHLANAVRSGALHGLRWRIVVRAMSPDTVPSDAGHAWTAYRVAASVSWNSGQSVTAETVRLAKSK